MKHGNLYGRRAHPIGAEEHEAPIPPANTYIPRPDGSMLSAYPIVPEASSARNQPQFHPSVQHQMARERAHAEAHLTSAANQGQGHAGGKVGAGMATPTVLVFAGALALLYALN